MTTAMTTDEAIRHLQAATEDLRNARGGMRLLRDDEDPRSELHTLMVGAIEATEVALDETTAALEILRRMARAEV